MLLSEVPTLTPDQLLIIESEFQRLAEKGDHIAKIKLAHQIKTCARPCSAEDAHNDEASDAISAAGPFQNFKMTRKTPSSQVQDGRVVASTSKADEFFCMATEVAIRSDV